MSWLKVVFGLITTAVGTEEGRQALNNVRSAIRRETPEPGPQTARSADIDYLTVQGLLAQQRSEIDRNLEAIVNMLTRQNEALAEINRRQRIWNIALATAFVIAVIVALLS
jgi:hypothetical protein